MEIWTETAASFYCLNFVVSFSLISLLFGESVCTFIIWFFLWLDIYGLIITRIKAYLFYKQFRYKNENKSEGKYFYSEWWENAEKNMIWKELLL